MKMTKKIFIIPALLLAVIGVFAFAMIPLSMDNSSPDSISIEYNTNVCKTVTRADGTVEPTECDHNLLYNSGKELIEAYLGDTGGATDEVDQISLCDSATPTNCGTPAADASETFLTITDRGLSETTGTYASLGVGNWTISNTFTATASVTTAGTRLQNTAAVNFAGNAFTEVSLESGDQLSIEWNIWIS